MSFTCFIELYIEDRLMRIILFGADLTSGDIMTSDPPSDHMSLRDLTEIRELGSCEDLTRWDITVHTIQPHILWEHPLEFCHERDKSCIIIWDEFSLFPDVLEFRVRRHYEGVDLHLIWTIVRIIKYFLHR